MTSETQTFPVLTNSAGARFELRPRGCPTCERSATRLLGHRGGKYHRYGLGIPTTIVQCRTCGLIFPDPFPYAMKTSDLYGDPDKYFAHWDEEHKVQWFRELVRTVVARSQVSNPGMLDVGCGRGEFLRAAQLEGLTNLLGLELATEMAQHAIQRGVPVEHATLEEFAARSDRTFDVVVLNAVLEHVYDPNSMIAAASRLTRSGAILYVEVPCEPHLLTYVGNALNRIRLAPGVFNLAPTWPPYHVFGFNPKALRILLRKHGFELESVRRSSSPVVPSRPELKDRVRASVATQINRVANLLGMASNMYAWARKV